MAELCFFLGKGGVGKTTISAAYAVHSAAKNVKKPVLLLSTDPAHSLSDVLEQALGDNPVPVRLARKGMLFAWQLNAGKRFRVFLNQHKEQILSVLEGGSFFSRADIEPFLETTLPGMAEMSALLAIDDALHSGKYHRIVVDTAPFGHTLRLFELPEHFNRFIDFLDFAASRDSILAAHFGGSAGSVGAKLLAEWRTMLARVQAALANDAKLFLVTTPEKFSLHESLRCRALLRAQSPSIEITHVVLNRAAPGVSNCGICRSRQRATRAARSLLKREFGRIDSYLAEDSGDPVAGVAALKLFGDHVFSGKRLNLKPPLPQASDVELRRAPWPVLDKPLALVLGKGGVGKTTISAALGFRTRSQAGVPVEICSVDPAPSLDDIFQAEVGATSAAVLGDAKFRASELDAASLFHEWVARVKQTIDKSLSGESKEGVHVDLWFERQLFSQLMDNVPPGLDEVLAVFRILDLLRDGSKRVVIDMAPTGHALELLRTPARMLTWTKLLLKSLAAHRTLAMVRDAAVKVAELGQRVRDLVERLGDLEHTQIYMVMLAEPLPDRETERLLSDLRGLNLPAKSMFVNRVLFPKDFDKCRRCRRARQWQLVTLGNLKRRDPGLSLYVVRNFPSEIAGKAALKTFTGELWRVV